MSKDAAMPTGVTIAGLGARAVVNILDAVPLALLSVLVSALVAQNPSFAVVLVVGTVASMLGLGWLVFLWWGYATRGQSPAASWLRIRVLRLADGRPLGWGRWFLRALVWYATMLVPVVWLLLVVLMLVEPRRRGWHDLAGQSVVVAAKAPTAPAIASRPVPRPAVASANMVSLPAHLMATQTPFVAEQTHDEREDTQRLEPITALPDFTRPAPVADSSSFAPSGPAPDAAWTQWGAQPSAPQHVYPDQVPYNPPAAYLQQPPNPYATQQPAPSVQPSSPSATQQPAPSVQPPNPYVQPAPAPQPPGSYAAQNPAPQAPYPPQPASYAAPQQVTYPPEPQRAPIAAAAGVPPYTQPVPQRMIVAEDEDLTRTHLAPVGKAPGSVRKATDGWQLRLDDGRMVPVNGLVLIGRSPRPKPDEQAELVQAGVESRMVSKTHLAVGLDHRGLYVMDRGSTNGTAIANSGGQFEPCAPGDPVRVREGQIVSFGDRYLEVRRDAQ